MRAIATLLSLALAFLTLPHMTLAAKEEHPETTRFWTSDALHTIHVRITAQQWQVLQPTRKGSLSRISASSVQAPSTQPATRPVLLPQAPSTQPDSNQEGQRLAPNFFGYEFAYVKADLEINGTLIKGVGFRQRGNSSFGWAGAGLKRPYKIDLNQFTDGLKYHGINTLYLNNNAYDPSLMREALAYETFRNLGVPAPRTAYAVLYLTIDGRSEKEYVGLYTLVEEIDSKAFLKDRFGSSKGTLFKPWSIRGLPYFGEYWEKYDRYYNPRNDITPHSASRTIDFIKLINYADDAAFRRQIADYLDVDAFLRLLAGDVLLANLDTFLFTGHNFYMYHDPTDDRFRLMPWDMNLAFANFTSAGSIDELVHLSVLRPHSGEMKLIDRLLAIPQYADLYRGHLRRAMATFFSPQAIASRIDSLQPVIAKADALADAAWREKAIKSNPAAATQPSKIPPRPIQKRMGWQNEPAIALKDFMTRRLEAINRQLAGLTDGYTPGSRRYPQPPPSGLRANVAYGYLPLVTLAALRGADTDFDARLTRAECLLGVKVLFDEADAARRGWIEPPALSQALARHFKQLPSPRRGNSKEAPKLPDAEAWARALFIAIDTEKTGRITLAQAARATELAYSRLDKENSNKVIVDQLLVLLDSIAAAYTPPPPPPVAKKEETRRPGDKETRRETPKTERKR